LFFVSHSNTYIKK